MCTTFEHNLHFYIMFQTSNYENDEIKQINNVQDLVIVYSIIMKKEKKSFVRDVFECII